MPFFGTAAISFARRHKLVTAHNANAVDPDQQFREIFCASAGTMIAEDEYGTTLTYTLLAGDRIPFVPRLVKTGSTATLYLWG